MKSLRAGQLVTVTTDDGAADAIISDTSHLPRVVVAMLGEEDKAVFETVGVNRLRPRHDPGPHDHALKALISAAGHAERSGPPGSGGSVVKGRPAHAGPRMHRPTGRGG